MIILFIFKFDFVLMIKLQNRKFYWYFISIWALYDVHVFCVTSGPVLMDQTSGAFLCASIGLHWCNYMLKLRFRCSQKQKQLVGVKVYTHGCSRKVFSFIKIVFFVFQKYFLRKSFCTFVSLIGIHFLYSSSFFLFQSIEIGNS